MNPVPWNKNRSKLSEFRSKPFHGRETCSKFRSEACLGQKQAVNYVCWSRIFVKPIIFLSFRSIPSFGIESSVKLGMPRNDHFLPRNKIHSESIPRNFFGTKFRCQPYLEIGPMRKKIKKLKEKKCSKLAWKLLYNSRDGKDRRERMHIQNKEKEEYRNEDLRET